MTLLIVGYVIVALAVTALLAAKQSILSVPDDEDDVFWPIVVGVFWLPIAAILIVIAPFVLAGRFGQRRARRALIPKGDQT